MIVDTDELKKRIELQESVIGCLLIKTTADNPIVIMETKELNRLQKKLKEAERKENILYRRMSVNKGE